MEVSISILLIFFSIFTVFFFLLFFANAFLLRGEEVGCA